MEYYGALEIWTLVTYMSSKPKYGKEIDDDRWGCKYVEVISHENIKKFRLCHVVVSDILKIAEELSSTVLDTSWMTNLDEGTRRSYRYTASQTAESLVKVFSEVSKSIKTEAVGVGAEFGELMVSIGSAKALESIFSHQIIPVAELWKPQVKGNEGFDFHTVSGDKVVNFGEAKFSTLSTPHGNAIGQIRRFIDEEKTIRDRNHLVNFVSKEAIQNLDDEKFGVVVAFSMNVKTPLTAFNNALISVKEKFALGEVDCAYIVGVSN
jgi:hypothetical protein